MADEPPRTQWVRLPTPSRGAPSAPTPDAGPPAPGPIAPPAPPKASRRVSPPPPDDPAAPFAHFQASPKTALLRKAEADQRKLSLLFALLIVLAATVAAGAVVLWVVLF